MFASRVRTAVVRQGPVLSVRGVATEAVESAESYPGSANYKPGKQGYAPGFPPPTKWRGAPRERPLPLLAKEVPPPSAKQRMEPERVVTAQDAGRLYNQKMRALRYGYFRESLEQREAREREEQQRRAEMQVLMRERKVKQRRERMDYERNVKNDPLSADNVLNAEGKTLLGNLAESGEAPSTSTGEGQRLDPPRVTVTMPKEENEARAQERDRNRELSMQRGHESRVQLLMTLFHDADSFVNYTNLNRKIDEFVSSTSFPNRSLTEMFEVLERSGSTVAPAEVAWRAAEVANVLRGTAGPHSGLGYDGLARWLEDHPEFKDESKE